jgi:hypothetical protein
VTLLYTGSALVTTAIGTQLEPDVEEPAADRAPATA